ncbi:hypothetical protein L1987_30800 [Smallanthus sonchifolius]|uniref:Uncharacterized protein n=1 Tax=Smallanthus sonchifolius TaxID=185202 RepID=A0ACB9I374_9ASTR|nr:hypothetical protein L1987_30800 [Smallanthus sonchifolius]
MSSRARNQSTEEGEVAICSDSEEGYYIPPTQLPCLVVQNGSLEVSLHHGAHSSIDLSLREMGGSKEGSFLSILTKAGNDKELINATNHPTLRSRVPPIERNAKTTYPQTKLKRKKNRLASFISKLDD